MRHKRPFLSDGPAFWQRKSQSTDDMPMERVVGHSKPGRDDGRRQSRRGEGDRYVAQVLDEDPDGGLQRVGGRHHIRRDVVAAAAGLVFVAAMLVKPWGGGQQPAPDQLQPNPTSQPSSGIADEALAPDASAPSATIAPYTPGTVASSTPETRILNVARADWASLAKVNLENTWGIATIALPPVRFSRGVGPSVPPSSSLQISWLPYSVPPVGETMTFQITRSQAVYAIAITWPRDVPVDSVVFEYLGFQNKQPYPYVPPDGSGIHPYSLFHAVPVNQLVVARPAASAAPLPPGSFWAAPIPEEATTSNAAVSASWQRDPWPWPLGQYRITATTGEGETLSMVVEIDRS